MGRNKLSLILIYPNVAPTTTTDKVSIALSRKALHANGLVKKAMMDL